MNTNEQKQYRLLKDWSMPKRNIPIGAIYEQYKTKRSFWNKKYNHFVTLDSIKGSHGWFEEVIPKKEKARITDWWFECHGLNGYEYCFSCTKVIENEAVRKVKEAIENALNPTNSKDTDAVPQWYSEHEIYEWLISKNYSKQIAMELSGYWFTDLQGAFKKGWEKAKHESKKEVDELMLNAFNAARECSEEMDIKIPEINKEKYLTFEDYKQSLESKTVIGKPTFSIFVPTGAVTAEYVAKEDEVVKDWEIMSFIVNKLDGYKGMVLQKTNEFFGISEFAVTEVELLKSPIHLIHSVKRLSDGVIFSVGNLISWGEIGNYEKKITKFRIKNERLEIGYGETSTPKYDEFYFVDFEKAIRLRKI